MKDGLHKRTIDAKIGKWKIITFLFFLFLVEIGIVYLGLWLIFIQMFHYDITLLDLFLGSIGVALMMSLWTTLLMIGRRTEK